LNFNDTKPSHWLKATKNLTIQESFENSEWIVVNIQQTGYYRVNYDISNWKLINHHLNDPTRYTQIATPNRAQLIDDAMNLARAGYLDYSVALDVTRYVMHEKDYVPWKAMINAMNYIDSMLRKGPDYEQLKVFLDAEFFTAILKYFLLPEIPSATNGQNLQGNWIRGPENR
jgi:aminopeptidase N